MQKMNLICLQQIQIRQLNISGCISMKYDMNRKIISKLSHKKNEDKALRNTHVKCKFTTNLDYFTLTIYIYIILTKKAVLGPKLAYILDRLQLIIWIYYWLLNHVWSFWPIMCLPTIYCKT